MALGEAFGAFAPHGDGGSALDIDTLEAEITTLAAHIGAATYRLLVLIEEFDRRAGWCGDGLRSCAHWLNWKCGIGMVAAREKVRVARALPGLPRIAEAMRVGKLSYSKVRALTRIAGPHNESALLSIAENGAASHVETTVRLYRRTDPERDTKRAVGQHDERGLSCYWDEDGSLVVKGRLPPEQGALVMKALEAADAALRADAVPADARDDSAEACPVAEERSHRQRQGDALALMAETLIARGAEALPAGDRHLVQVHVDLDALSGSADPADSAESCEARCHIDDGPTLARDVARRLACDGGVLVVFEDAHGKTLDVGRKTRAIPPALRRALENRDRGCRFPGCTATRFVDAHHIEHWANGGATRLDNLALLCRFHHRLVHEGGFTLEHDNDRLTFRRPDGRELRAVPVPAALQEDGQDALQRKHAELDLAINPRTPVPGWRGERADYNYILTMLEQREARRTRGGG